MRTISLLVVACALAACDSGVRSPARTMPTEVEPPTPSPTIPPDTEAARTLLDVPFLDGLPTDNRVSDEVMGLDTMAWFFEDAGTGMATTHVKKAAFAVSPAGQNALFFPHTENPNGVAFGASFKIPAGAYDASLWVAVPVNSKQNGFVTGVITFDAGGVGQPRFVGLDADTKTATDVGAVHWVSYHSTIAADVVSGWGYLYAVTDGQSDYWVGAPVITAAKNEMHQALAGSTRSIDQREARWLAHARRARPEPRIPSNGFATRVGARERYAH